MNGGSQRLHMKWRAMDCEAPNKPYSASLSTLHAMTLLLTVRRLCRVWDFMGKVMLYPLVVPGVYSARR